MVEARDVPWPEPAWHTPQYDVGNFFDTTISDSVTPMLFLVELVNEIAHRLRGRSPPQVSSAAAGRPR